MIAEIETTNDRLTELIGSLESQDYELYLQRLEDASVNNSNIVSEEDQEENEEIINAIYIKIFEKGTDSLDSGDSTNIAILTAMCPYIGGTAVYKARTLNAMYAPSLLYDDISICNAIGVYKNGNNENTKGNSFEQENAFLSSLKPKNELLKQNNDKFVLYPNPAHTMITITYKLHGNEKGNLIVYDILGREQMKIDLHYTINKVSENTTSLPQGVYTYKYLVNNTQKETGKLLIE